MLKHDSERGAFFRVGSGTAARRVYLNRVTFFTMPNGNTPPADGAPTTADEPLLKLSTPARTLPFASAIHKKPRGAPPKGTAARSPTGANATQKQDAA